MNGPIANWVVEQFTAPMRLALESRAGLELGAMLAAQPLLALAPKGDGHPVLVLPRLLGGDLDTAPLRAYLTGLGYAVYPWANGVNLGPRAGVLDACGDRLTEIHDRHGQRVSLIGWSLGGLFARALAKRQPDAVRGLIGLGTPLRGNPPPTELWRLCGQLIGEPMGLPEDIGRLEQPPPLPATAIFSRTDGIVPWRWSLEADGPLAENIEIEASHLGLAVNPLALYAIADRLAQPEGAWQPFRPTGPLSLLYPDPRRDGWW